MKKEKDLKAKIKEMEAKKREDAIVPLEPEVEVTFDSWFHQRKHMIPKNHLKEIIIADFKARGLGLSASMVAYDKALSQYGIKLK